MASTVLREKKIKECLERDGCYDLEDPVAGERFNDLEDRGRRFVTPYGIDFLKVIILNPVRLTTQYPKVILSHPSVFVVSGESSIKGSPSGTA